MTSLVRTKQGPFVLSDCLAIEDWTYETLCKEITEVSARKDELPYASADLKPALKLEVEEAPAEEEG